MRGRISQGDRAASEGLPAAVLAAAAAAGTPRCSTAAGPAAGASRRRSDPAAARVWASPASGAALPDGGGMPARE